MSGTLIPESIRPLTCRRNDLHSTRARAIASPSHKQRCVTSENSRFRATSGRRLNWPRWLGDQISLREGGPRLEKTVREASGQAFGRNVSRPIDLGVIATMIDCERRPEPKSRWTRHVAQCEESFEPGARSEPPLSLAEKPKAADGDVATEVMP